MDPVSGTQETGLFKVRGTCVEAVVGAIYHYRVCDNTNHQGAQVAQQFFLSRILPNTEKLTRDAPASIKESINKTSREAAEALHHSP